MDKLCVEELEMYDAPEQIKDTADDKLSSLVNILKDIPDEKILEALKNMG